MPRLILIPKLIPILILIVIEIVIPGYGVCTIYAPELDQKHTRPLLVIRARTSRNGCQACSMIILNMTSITTTILNITHTNAGIS